MNILRFEKIRPAEKSLPVKVLQSKNEPPPAGRGSGHQHTGGIFLHIPEHRRLLQRPDGRNIRKNVKPFLQCLSAEFRMTVRRSLHQHHIQSRFFNHVIITSEKRHTRHTFRQSRLCAAVIRIRRLEPQRRIQITCGGGFKISDAFRHAFEHLASAMTEPDNPQFEFLHSPVLLTFYLPFPDIILIFRNSAIN